MSILFVLLGVFLATLLLVGLFFVIMVGAAQRRHATATAAGGTPEKGAEPTFRSYAKALTQWLVSMCVVFLILLGVSIFLYNTTPDTYHSFFHWFWAIQHWPVFIAGALWWYWE